MLNLIKKLKPNLGKYNPGQLVDMLADVELAGAIEAASNPEYLYYDGLQELPPNMEKEKFWAIVKVGRKYSGRPLPPLNFNERPFMLVNLFKHNEIFYRLDNNIFTGQLYNKQDEAEALIEEAVYSAAIEDTEIKTRAARRFLLESTEAATAQEKLVKRSYKLYRDILAQKKVSAEFLLSFSDAGRFRNDDEQERLVNSPSNPDMVCYIAPPLRVFERELQRLIGFANDELEHQFMHPLAKAALIHFWALVLKPLPQNNGILARALQYWYLHRSGRKNLLLPVSKAVRADLAGYSNAISCAAQDDNDYTYFQDYMLRMLENAGTEQNGKLQKTGDFELNILPSLQRDAALNSRQAKLIYELCRSRSHRTNFSGYMQENAVTRKTAADDLKELEREGYLLPQKIGRNIFYYASPKAAGLFS